MNEIQHYIETLFAGNQITVSKNKTVLFDEFVQDEANTAIVNQILEHQKKLMDNWKLKSRIAEILQQNLLVPNGTVGKPYEAKIDIKQLGWDDVALVEFSGLEALGLKYDMTDSSILGTPTESGDIKCLIRFRVEGEAVDGGIHEKNITLIINPDPKTLWKNIPSDKTDFWKEDEAVAFDTLGDRHIVAASKRGRSHANTGSFRDDDFAYQYFKNTGWSLVAVADGAGSAKLSRHGSRIACTSVVDYFSVNLTEKTDAEFQSMLTEYKHDSNEEVRKKISHFVYNDLSKAAYYAHQQLAEASKQAEVDLKDLHTTLIFALFKKFDVGYAFISFGVGDCPIALLNKDYTEVTLMNWLDVGEFGGGTRFITMPELFTNEKFSTRFRFKLTDDFSYLFLMTDGIYDAKFVVEANLEKPDKWKEFLKDLKGNNDDNASLRFDEGNKELGNQLSAWMNFWSAGNHDDRTLAIVF